MNTHPQKQDIIAQHDKHMWQIQNINDTKLFIIPYWNKISRKKTGINYENVSENNQIIPY